MGVCSPSTRRALRSYTALANSGIYRPYIPIYQRTERAARWGRATHAVRLAGHVERTALERRKVLEEDEHERSDVDRRLLRGALRPPTVSISLGICNSATSSVAPMLVPR